MKTIMVESLRELQEKALAMDPGMTVIFDLGFENMTSGLPATAKLIVDSLLTTSVNMVSEFTCKAHDDGTFEVSRKAKTDHANRRS